MFKYLKEYRFYIILFLFLLIPIISIDTSTRHPRDYHFFDRVIIRITGPIQLGISLVLEHAINTYNDYIYLWHTRKDNLALIEENRNLNKTIATLKEAEQENVRLKNLLAFREKTKTDFVVGRVIARDISPEFRALRVNRGEDSGIRKNMAVVTHEGVVGRVLRTTATTSDVVTILDLQSAIDVLSERSRARGIVEGYTDELAQLKFVHRTDDLKVGDALIASGLGGVFPKGIPVGTVFSVSKRKFGISQDVEVRPAVDFDKLEEVAIVLQSQTQAQTQAEAHVDAGVRK